MSEYIINPMIFYWMGLLENLGVVAVMLLVLTSTIAIAAGIMWYVQWDEGCDDEARRFAKIGKLAMAVFVACAVLCVVIPDR